MDSDLDSLRQQLVEARRELKNQRTLEREARERAKHDLDELDRRRESVLTVLRAGTFSWLQNERIMDWNESFSVLHGFDPDTTSPDHEVLLARIPAEHHDDIINTVVAAMHDEATFDIVYPVTWSDGSKHWVLARGVWELEENGDPVRLDGFALDADAQIRSEQALANSEHRLQQAQAAGGVGVWDFDTLTQTAHVSEEYLRIHGFDSASYSLTHYREYVPKEDLALQQEAFKRAATPGSEYDVEHRIIHAKTGELRWVHGRGTAEFDDAGNVIRLMGTTQDITERKLAELRYAESNNTFQILTQALPTLVFRIDQAGQLTFVNTQRWCEFTGRDENGWQGVGFWKPFHPDDFKKAEKVWSELIVKRVPYQGEFRWRHINGEILWLLFDAQPIHSDEGFVGFVGTAMNVTQTKESEQERARLQLALADTQKMEAIGTLASGVAHDFNNLLAGLRGYIELAALDLDAESKPASYLSLAQAAIDQARNVTEGLLTFARRNPANKRSIAFNEVVAQSMGLLRKLVPASIAFDVSTPDEEILLFADETQISQVLTNLVINARDAMPGGGKLSVQLKATDEYATLTVADNGQGMNEATLGRVFEPFYTTKPHGEGTGLGLSIAHGIVRAHEGSVEIQSTPGEGSQVFVTLPRVLGEAEQNTGGAGIAERHGNGEHLLVVEDNDLVRESCVLRLNAAGYNAHGVSHGRAALTYVRALEARNPIEAAVLDVDLPGENGVAVAQRLRELSPELPVVYVTGNVRNQALAKSGADPILAKPIEFGELLANLESFLHSS